MKRRTLGIMSVVLVFIVVLPVQADFESGQQAWDDGQLDLAVAQWRTAAAAGDSKAMLALGRRDAHGLGLLQNYVIAHMWLNLAASRGEVDAVQERDELGAKMTSEQIAAAQEHAAAWRPGITGTSAGTLVSANTRKSPAYVKPIREPGPPPKAIREAQRLLEALGFAPGPADGKWGFRSARAYVEFLRDAGLQVSDNLTPYGLRAMRDDLRRQRDEEAAAADDATFAEMQNRACPSSSCKAEAYASYLRLHPEGRHAGKAKRFMEEEKRRAEDEAFAEARSKGTANAYQQFLFVYQDGQHSNEAGQIARGCQA